MVTALRPASVADAAVKELSARSEGIAKAGGTPSGGRQGRQATGRDLPEGHRQRRHPRAVQRAAPHGDPHGDDHRRIIPLTAAAIAAEAGRRRLPRPGDARGQAETDPRRAGSGQAGSDVWGRHQRRPCSRSGRCRRGDEHRHHGGARGWQHGGPRQRPDEADRDRGNRQAVADDPRRADHVLSSPTTWRSTSP